MSRMNDHSYFADRADQENAVGDCAASPGIAAIHYELAHRYALLASDNSCDIIPFPKRA